MSIKQKQKKTSKIGWIIVANVVMLFFLLLGFGREYVSNIQIEREIKEREAERDQLLDEQSDTLQLIDQLSSEYYLEKEARLKHGLGKTGETVIVVQDGTNSIAYADPNQFETDNENDELENPTKWFFYFFDRAAFENLK